MARSNRYFLVWAQSKEVSVSNVSFSCKENVFSASAGPGWAAHEARRFLTVRSCASIREEGHNSGICSFAEEIDAFSGSTFSSVQLKITEENS
jgi:hypothetical protein